MTHEGSNRDQALELLVLGWSVLPMHSVSSGRCTCGCTSCAAPGKHPRIAWEGLTDRLPLEEEVRRWWGRWPEANLGVVTGARSGLVVIDVDPRNGGDVTLAALEDLYAPMPATVVALTGGGGIHVYFRHPGERLPCRPIAPGLDLKADGGLVVVPPSIHASGRTYVWDHGHAPGEIRPAEMPEWLIELARGASTSIRRAASRTAPLRTSAERQEFAALWRGIGIRLEVGDNYYLCPFHPDHHPSLHIDSEGCRFYCFGCTLGGGIGTLRWLAASSSAHRVGSQSSPQSDRRMHA